MGNKPEIVFENIKNRRTVKPDRYTGNAVDDDLIHKMLEAAHWAPTHGHTEPWHFVVFTRDGKEKLFGFLKDWLLEEGANEVRIEKTRKRIEQSSHIIAIGMKRGDNPKIPEIEEFLAVACAVQNMWLMASSLGLGAYWSTGEKAFQDRMGMFLGLGKEDQSMGFLYVGEINSKVPDGHRLTKIDDHIKWVKS